MLQVGMIGCGNAGNQTVEEMFKSYPDIPVMAINCSENDMVTISDDIPKKLIGDGKGAGKNRSEAKKFLAQKIQDLMGDPVFKETFANLDIVFIVSSAGGGTGSGISLLLTKIIKATCKKVFPIPVGILPTISEAYSTQGNALEYLSELYTLLESPTYMLYDNEKAAKLPTNRMMEEVNRSIVKDVNVLRGFYNISTKYASIDEKDALTIITTPGRLMLASSTGIREKELGDTTIEDMIIDSIKKCYHVDLQRDRNVNRTGVIAILSETLLNGFDSHMPKVQELIGTPIEEFEHLALTPERSMPNNVFLIMSGLSKANERIRDINNRIEEINKAQQIEKDNDELDADIIEAINGKKIYRKDEPVGDKADVSSLFEAFGVDLSTL